MAFTARIINTRAHEGKYRKSASLSRSFGGKNGVQKEQKVNIKEL